jgi:hypothetical protein
MDVSGQPHALAALLQRSTGRLSGPHSTSGHFGEEIHLLPLPVIKHQTIIV